MSKSTLIPSVTLTEFKKAIQKLNAEQIRQIKSCEVSADNEPLFYIIVPPANAGMTITDTMRTEAEYLAARGNTVGGRDIAELLEAKRAAV